MVLEVVQRHMGSGSPSQGEDSSTSEGRNQPKDVKCDLQSQDCAYSAHLAIPAAVTATAVGLGGLTGHFDVSIQGTGKQTEFLVVI